MILVTGAGGKIGTSLVDLIKGVPFRATYNSPGKLVAARERGIDAMAIDYAKPDTLEPALQGVDTVFLLSAGPGHVQLEANIVAAAQRAGIKRIVKLSVWMADQELYEIGAGHRAIERMIEKSGIPWTFLRPNGFMQNYLGDAATIKAHGAFYRQSMDRGVSFIDVRDVARSALQVLTTSGHDNKAYELSGPERLTNVETANILSRVLGRIVTYVPVSAESARTAMRAAGLPNDRIDSIENLMSAYQKGVGESLTPDLENLIGQPAICFEQFVKDNIAAFQ
ncbi:MAG: SDR family oxidoreductase [Pseudomonadota bacterium]|uniref:SDR family oxidoreductase n=1 Tax=Burkholderiaceae TaxID=119060 RepID=UPI0010F76BCA|nr:SDR family oxidoreductase [Burkholderia sp. 4M9327F10]